MWSLLGSAERTFLDEAVGGRGERGVEDTLEILFLCSSGPKEFIKQVITPLAKQISSI